MVLYYTNTIPKAIIYRKSAKAARIDSTYYTKAPISLVMAAIGGIKS